MCNRPTSVQSGSVDSNCPLSPEDLLPNALAFSCGLRERSPGARLLQRLVGRLMSLATSAISRSDSDAKAAPNQNVDLRRRPHGAREYRRWSR
jgi:hypothetical protein